LEIKYLLPMFFRQRARHKSDTDHVCPFVRGFLTGVFSGLAGVPHVLEITCCYVHGGAEDSTFSLKPIN
jgi:predicted hydrocarbon binding protein